MKMVTREQYKVINDSMELYRNYCWEFTSQIPDKLARSAAVADLYDSLDRACEAMKMNILEGENLERSDLSFMLESVKWHIKTIKEKVETNPDRKDLLDDVEELKSIQRAILSWYLRFDW